MKVKRYIGHNTYEAMQKISEEMGKDAIILNTRKIRQKGITGLFKKPLVEVVAAVDERVSPSYKMLQEHRMKWPNNDQGLSSDQNPFTGNAPAVLKQLEDQISTINRLVNKLTYGVNVMEGT